MNDFIQMAMSQLGLNQQTAQSATGSVLQMIQKNAPAGDFGKLLQSVPGAGDMLKMAGGTAGGGGGGLGGLLGAASGLLGGKLGAAAGALSMLEKSGLGADKIGPFANLLMGYLKNKGGADLVSGLLSNVPDLKKLMG